MIFVPMSGHYFYAFLFRLYQEVRTFPDSPDWSNATMMRAVTLLYLRWLAGWNHVISDLTGTRGGTPYVVCAEVTLYVASPDD